MGYLGSFEYENSRTIRCGIILYHSTTYNVTSSYRESHRIA
ncbi:hypothetical protein VPHK460_0081 [Vibrio phage K460]